MLKLSSRLQKIYDFIPKCRILADIGCDHGYLSIAVAQSELADKIIAMDINKGPLESANANVTQMGLNSKIELRLSDGMRKLELDEVDVVCVCGMGGLLMKRIIETDLQKAKNATCLILEPQSEMMEFRRFLLDNKFIIDDEEIATEENKFYPIIRAHYDAESAYELTEVQLKYGPCLLKKAPELLVEYLNKSKLEYSEIITNLKGKIETSKKSEALQKRINELEYEIKLINEAFELLGGYSYGKGDN